MITSYGIILYTILDGIKYFLIGKRPDTLEFLDMFNIRCPIEKVEMYVNMCSDFERWKLREYFDDFEKIYYDSFSGHRDYREICERWEKIKPIVKKALNKSNESIQSRSMYILPKGRKKIRESVEQAALREFEEETRISIDKIEKDRETTYVDNFIGSDGKSYKTVYFVYKTNTAWMPPKIKSASLIPNREYKISFEIESLLWITADQVNDYFDKGLASIIQKI